MEDPVGSGVEGVEKYHLPLAQVVSMSAPYQTFI